MHNKLPMNIDNNGSEYLYNEQIKDSHLQTSKLREKRSVLVLRCLSLRLSLAVAVQRLGSSPTVHLDWFVLINADIHRPALF